MFPSSGLGPPESQAPLAGVFRGDFRLLPLRVTNDEQQGAEAPAARSGRRTPRALQPFRVVQYRILTGALVISMLGAGTWLVGIIFEVRALGGGPTDLSFVAALNGLGLVVAALFGGAIADRIPQKRILVTVECVKTLGMATAAVLGLTGNIEIWHLAVISLLLGVADAFFYPAYSALLPGILAPEDLLAANGLEATLRPTIMNAAGPALASGVIAAFSPAAAFLVVAVLQLFAIAGLIWLRTTPVRRDFASDVTRHPVTAMFVDIRDGFVYMVKTPWLLATLIFASLFVLIVIGPIDVLLPFAVTDQTGGGPAAFALVLGAFGIGGAVAALIVASLKLPRRYLTVMNLAWGLGCVPLVLVGYTDQLWVMVLAALSVGVGFSVGGVIWGTLLQRRVPPAMLGRVSSLDFFVSCAFLPISMALAGPIGELIGFGPVFLAAGIVPVVLAVLVILMARMPRDEIRHPLDIPAND